MYVCMYVCMCVHTLYQRTGRTAWTPLYPQRASASATSAAASLPTNLITLPALPSPGDSAMSGDAPAGIASKS